MIHRPNCQLEKSKRYPAEKNVCQHPQNRRRLSRVHKQHAKERISKWFIFTRQHLKIVEKKSHEFVTPSVPECVWLIAPNEICFWPSVEHNCASLSAFWPVTISGSQLPVDSLVSTFRFYLPICFTLPHWEK